MAEKVVEMAINASGVRDAARVLKINKNTVINTLKKGMQPYSGKSELSNSNGRCNCEFVCEEAVEMNNGHLYL